MAKSSNAAFYGVIAFLITVASFIYSWKFIIPKYQNNQRDIAQYDQEIKDARLKFESLKTTQTELASLGDIVNQMLVAVPSDKDSPNLITELEAVAKKHHIVLPSIQISDTATASSSGAQMQSTAGATTTNTASSGENKVGVSFAVTGSFDDIHDLVSDLEKDLRFMNIQSVAITLPNEENAQGLSAAIQLNAYKRVDTSLTADTATSASLDLGAASVGN